MRGGETSSSGLGGVINFSSTSVRSVTISLVNGSPCNAFASRSVDNCSALNPRISVRLESWHDRHSFTDGMLWRLPSATTATSATPFADASTASVSASFQA